MRKGNVFQKFAIAALLLLACFTSGVFGQTSGSGTITGTLERSVRSRRAGRRGDRS